MLSFEKWREEIPPSAIHTPTELLDSIPTTVTLANFWDFVRHHNAREYHTTLEINGEKIVVVAKVKGIIADVFFGWYQYCPGRFVIIKMPQYYQINDVGIQQRFLIERLLLEQQNVNQSRLYWPWLLDEGDIAHPDTLNPKTTADQKTTSAVIEVIPGVILGQLMQQYPTITSNPAFVAAVGMQIKHAHAVMHEHNVVNRDIKPENIIIVNSKPFVRLFDANTAYMPDAGITAPGIVCGTPAYMAPEVANGETPIPQSDDYSLGCLLYEMLSGETPFQGSGPLIMQRHINDTPRAIQTPLWPIVARLLAKGSAERYRTDLDLLNALKEHALRNPELAGRIEPALEDLEVA